MEWTMSRTHTPTPEILRATFPQIRLFKVPRLAVAEPQRAVNAAWTACSPDTVRNFSAVGYYFGLEIHRALGVPVGLINSSWGGTRIEPWTPPAGFRAVRELDGVLRETDTLRSEYREALPAVLTEWEAWLEASAEALSTDSPLPEPPERPQHPLSHQRQPTALYNGMIHPLVPFSIQGAIWYQGEANRDDGLLYQAKMEALIRGWRDVWSNPELSFFFVQLAPFNYAFNWQETGGDVPDFLRLPMIWEAQRKTLSLPYTGMAVITDITNLYDIHPRNKKEVGRRLSLWALARTYGREDLIFSGPLYRSMQVVGDRIRLNFEHVGGGLISMDGQPLKWFEIAGPDRVFYKARAEIRGDGVVVWSPRVPSPSAVRMGWHQLAVPNLGNREGLPASPFRTDRY
jgi:sialate O-acetylesterase